MGNCSTAMEEVGSLPVLATALIRACAALFVRRHGAGQERPRWRPHRCPFPARRGRGDRSPAGTERSPFGDGGAEGGGAGLPHRARLVLIRCDHETLEISAARPRRRRGSHAPTSRQPHSGACAGRANPLTRQITQILALQASLAYPGAATQREGAGLGSPA